MARAAKAVPTKEGKIAGEGFRIPRGRVVLVIESGNSAVSPSIGGGLMDLDSSSAESSR